jgi:hypothetical protein
MTPMMSSLVYIKFWILTQLKITPSYVPFLARIGQYLVLPLNLLLDPTCNSYMTAYIHLEKSEDL